MKKKLTSEKEFSEGFDQAIEEDKQKSPEAYKENGMTFRDYITGQLKLKVAKKIIHIGYRCQRWA